MSYGHGFGQKTLIQLPNQLHKTIHVLCLESLHKSTTIASYDIANSCTSTQCLKIGKKSKSNCYIKLGFSTQFDVTNDIICTPSQEFYVPAYRKWLPAYMLKSGDALLTSNLTTQHITTKEFVPKPLNIYMLEVEQTHTFFEVWDKRGNWIGVANLDGSKNHKKSNAEKDPASRNIKKIL